MAQRYVILGLALSVLLLSGIARAQADGNCTVDIYGRTVQLSPPVCAAMAEAGDDVCSFVRAAAKRGVMDEAEKQLSPMQLIR